MASVMFHSSCSILSVELCQDLSLEDSTFSLIALDKAGGILYFCKVSKTLLSHNG